MPNRAWPRKQKTMSLQRGLYVVRYSQALDEAAPPFITLTLDETCQQAVLHPDGGTETVLTVPGDAFVIIVTENSTLHVEVRAQTPLGSTQATLKFEAFSTLGGATAAVGEKHRDDDRRSLDSFGATHNIEVLGHLARIGDTVVAPDEWLGGPTMPSRIEGIELRWPDRPRGVDIQYAVRSLTPKPVPMKTVRIGNFAGFRGKALAIGEIRMELIGPAAQSFQLTAEALFLGSAPKSAQGSKVTLAGSTGREPLVGLRLSVEDAIASRSAAPSQSNVAQSGRSGSAQPRTPISAAPGNVRIFRA